MPQIGLVFNGVWSQYTFATAAKYKDHFQLMYVHDLNAAMLTSVDALCIPFQSNHVALAKKKDLLYSFLREGKPIFVEGDSSAHWLDADWVDRPVNNYWWVTDPDQPPVTETDYTHPVYQGLKPRHACWHTHGAYTRVPASARVIQRNQAGEVITWETEAYGGRLLVTTLDPIVEHGIQQITHLDHYVDRLVAYLIGVSLQGRVVVDTTMQVTERA